jgi:soluble lytic murein transglycosylase-like protein
MIAAALVLTASASILSAPSPAANKYRSVLTREAQFVLGLDAPIPMFAAQIEQESGWRPEVTAWDNGRGLAQFMDPTTDTITRAFPDLGKGDPYNPQWAIRALVRYDMWLRARVKGVDACNDYAAALKGYNAGLGYVQQAQRASKQPEQWFGVTEFVLTHQTAKNFEYSRMYPRWIIFNRQPKYKGWGTYTCEGVKP